MTMAPRAAPENVRVVNQTFSSCSLEKGTAHSVLSGMSMSEDGDVDYELPQDVAERLVKRTELRVSQVISQSKFVQENCSLYELPRFTREDMEIGPMIAYGGFSNVHEIESFKVDTDLTKGEMSEKRYIIKHLNPKLAFNPKKLVVGAKDLVMEAHFLSSLDHGNIIRLRGWSTAGVGGFASTGRADGFFLLFDRLASTLSKRIAQWREESKRRVKSSIINNNRSSARMQLFNERIKTAIDISSAISYLHDKRVLYRDLKPANVGFDAEDQLKIFDFGLAVELPASDDPNQTYNLAGNTGTSRYMAVEVIRKQPYNCKADVWSFSVLLWELMALTKPYDGLVGHQVKECVSVFGERPSIPRSWPTNIRRLLRRGWSESIDERPTMDEVQDTLEKLLESTTKQSKSFFGRSSEKEKE